MHLVLDTNIVVSGLIWGGIPRQLMERGRDNSVSLFTSSALLDELAEVLGRGKFASMLAPQAITPAFLMQRDSGSTGQTRTHSAYSARCR